MSSIFLPERTRIASGGMLNVFAVDPGVRTGWAWAFIPVEWLVQDGVIESLSRCAELDVGMFLRGEMSSKGEEGEPGVVERLNGFMWRGTERGAAYWPGAVSVTTSALVIESFQLRVESRDASLLSPVRLLAMLRLSVALGLTPAKEIITYQPSQAKTVCNDERMKRWGLWKAGSQHATDATRHLVLYLRALRSSLSSTD